MTITTDTWDTDASAGFNTASYWNLNVPPGANSYTVLPTYANAYTVTSSANNTIEALQVTAPATLSIAGGTFTVYSADNSYGNPQSDAVNSGTIAVAGSFVMGKAGSAAGSSSFMDNAGTMNVSGSLVFAAPGNSLRGGGHINLSGSGKIVALNTASTLNNHDNIISGSGTIGSQDLTFQNFKSGTVNANAAAGLTLNTGTNSIYNSGTIETTGAGGLAIDSGMSNQGSLLAAGTGALRIVNADVQGGGRVAATVAKAAIDLQGATLDNGGGVSTVAGSSIVSVSGTNEIDTGDFENAGTLAVASGSTLLLGAFLHNTGTVQVGSGTSAGKIEIDTDNSSLNGSGTVVLSNTASNQIVSTGAEASFTNRGNVISGAGTIGDADLRFVNLTGGTVNANGSAALSIVGDSAAGESTDYNSGLVETTGTGGLTISGVFGNSGTVAASGTGALTLKNVTSTNGGLFETTKAGASIVLSNSSISGGTFTVAAGSTLTLAAGTTDSILETSSNAGTINIASGATLIGSDNHWTNTGAINLTSSKWEVGNSETNSSEQLVGAGKVNLLGSGSSIVSNGSAATFRNVNATIAGGGTIGDANLTLQNELGGVIAGTGTAGLTLNTGSNDIFNDGIIESNSLAGVLVDSAVESNGTLASSAGNLHFMQAVTNGGIVNITGSGEVEFNLGDENDVHFGTGASGTLRLDHSATAADAFTGTIYGGTSKDAIDLSDIAYVQGTTTDVYRGSSAGTLTVSEGSQSTTLDLIGPYAQSSFTLTSDGHGGTLVKL